MKSALLDAGFIAFDCVRSDARPVEITAPVNESAFRTGSDITLMARCAAGSRKRYVHRGRREHWRSSVRRSFCVEGRAFRHSCGFRCRRSRKRAGAGVRKRLGHPAACGVRPGSRAGGGGGSLRAAHQPHLLFNLCRKALPFRSLFRLLRFMPRCGAASRSTLEGFRDSGRFYPRVAAVAEVEDTTAPLAAFGVRRVAVILVNYLNDSRSLRLRLSRLLMAVVSQYYPEVSYQQFSVTADVYGPLNAPIDSVCLDPTGASDTHFGSSFTTMTNAGIQAADAAGIDLTPYESYMLVGPPLGAMCGSRACDDRGISRARLPFPSTGTPPLMDRPGSLLTRLGTTWTLSFPFV